MSKSAAIELCQIGQSARDAADRSRAYDTDAALQELIEAGGQLHGALSRIVCDWEFWDRLRDAADRAEFVPRKEQDELLKLLDDRLPSILELLEYRPPPSIDSVTTATHQAVADVLTSNPPSRVRLDRLEDELRTFLPRFSDLLRTSPYHREPRRLRWFTYCGAGAATALAIAGVAIGVEEIITVLGGGALAAKTAEKLAERLAGGQIERARRFLAGTTPLTEGLSSQSDPVICVKAFARLLESQLAFASLADADLDQVADAAHLSLDHLTRSAERIERQPIGLKEAVVKAWKHLERAGDSLRDGYVEKARAKLLKMLRVVERIRATAESIARPSASAPHWTDVQGETGTSSRQTQSPGSDRY